MAPLAEHSNHFQRKECEIAATSERIPKEWGTAGGATAVEGSCELVGTCGKGLVSVLKEDINSNNQLI